MQMRNPNHPQLVLDVIARLHSKGFGRLKLICYTKDGVGAWRYLVFAADDFPDGRIHSNIPQPLVRGSYPDWKLIQDTDVEAAAASFAAENQELMRAAQGSDVVYTEWFSSVAALARGARLEMERADLARIDRLRIYTPYQTGWDESDA